MTTIPDEIEALFLHLPNKENSSLLAYYQCDNDYFIFLYEKSGTPNISTCDMCGNQTGSARIPPDLPVLMREYTQLKKENEKLKKEIKELLKKN
jgi:hypothetical protein